MKDPHTLFRSIVETIEDRFYDAEFLAGDWVRAKEDASARFAKARTRGECEEVLSGLVTACGVSHCLLITPEIRAEIETKTADPRRLRPIWRREGSTLVAAVRSMKTTTTTRADIEALAAELEDAAALVLDLRLNDGGSGTRVAEVMSLFAPAGTPVLRIRDREGRARAEPHVMPALPEEENLDHALEVSIMNSEHFVEYRTLDTGVRFPGEIVVLVGPRCYSCGEVLAQAMKEHTQATLVGAPTAGAVVAADEIELAEGYGLILPFAEMESGRGVTIEGRGVAPHVRADLEGIPDEELLPRLASLGLLSGGSAA